MFIKGKFLINLILFFIYMKILNEICIVLGMYLSSERILLVCEYSGDFVYLLELKDMLFLFGFLYCVYFFFIEVMVMWILCMLWNENLFMFIFVY